VKAAGSNNRQAFDKFLTSEEWKHADTVEILSSLGPDQSRKVFSGSNAVLQQVLSLLSGDAENAHPDDIATSDTAPLLSEVNCIVELLYSWAMDETHAYPEKYVESCNVLKQLFFSCPENKDGIMVQQNIVRLFERLYLAKCEFAKEFMPIAVPLLIDESLGPEGKDVTVKRVWALRSALELFDYEDESSQFIKELFLRCFSAPLYYKNAESRRLLAHILTTIPSLVKDITGVLRSQLPGTQKSAEQIGEVIFKAWSNAEGVPKALIERFCIQDFMQRGIHAAFPETFKAVRKVVQEFTERKKVKAVDTMLLHCYEPILFRALGAANSVVRKNAALLFFDVFPLRDSNMSKPEADALLQRQFDAIAATLADVCPAVREVSILGIAAILNKYWEVIPAGVSRMLLTRMVEECSLDVRSPAVRAAVPAAFSFMLSQVLALPVMASILPSASHLIHDRSDKVRTAMFKLLKSVSTIKTLNMFEIIPMDDLMARLTLDAAQPAQALPIVEILTPYILPANMEVRALLKHLVTLLTSHEAALGVFFSYAHQCVNTELLVDVVLIFKKALESSILNASSRTTAVATTVDTLADIEGFVSKKKSKGRKAAAAIAPAAPSDNGATKVLDSSNSKLMAAISSIQAIIWTSLQGYDTEDEGNEAALEKLTGAFEGEAIASLLGSLTANASAESANYHATITTSLLTIAGYLEKEHVVGLAESVWNRLCSISHDESMLNAGVIPACLHCLSAWGEAENVLQAATAALTAVLAPVLNIPAPEIEGSVPNPHIAIAAVECMLLKASSNSIQMSIPIISQAMSVLTSTVQALSVALQNALVTTEDQAIEIASLSQEAAQAWCRVLMQQLAVGGDDSVDAAAIASATLNIMAKVCKEALLKTGLVFSDAVERGRISQDNYKIMVPLESGSRNIIALMCATAADIAAMGYGGEAAAQMFAAVTSANAVHNMASDATHSYTALSPVEWITMDNGDADDAVATSKPPAAYMPLMRLGLKLIPHIYSAPSMHEHAMPQSLRVAVKVGLARLCNLAPTVESEDGTAITSAEASLIVVSIMAEAIKECIKNDRVAGKHMASPNAEDFFAAILPEAETTLQESCAAVQAISSGSAVGSMADFESTTMKAIVQAACKQGSPASLALAQALAQRVNIMALVEKRKVTGPLKILLATISGFVSTCKADVVTLLHAVLTHASIESDTALQTVVNQMESSSK
jgi:hypothetical protein